MPKKKGGGVPSNTLVRRCTNIRSKKHPDSQCPNPASHGEFCARHYKNPTRFQEKTTVGTPTYSKNTAAEKIQRWWLLWSGFLRFQRQGPAANAPADAENQTDVYTLDFTASIPMMYRWSYADSKKHMWLFDIRSISMTRAQDSREAILNPYTREPFSKSAESSYTHRCEWLRKRKYCLVHLADTALTPEQLWHQRILDVTMKYDALGYHTCLNWFEELSASYLWLFYAELWDLWSHRLQLSQEVKQLVVPNWNSAENLLFKWNPSELRYKHDKKWWQKSILDLLDRFVSSAQLKEHKILGALYGMTAFAIASPRVREHYPWLVEMQEDTF
jgi:hypothetical protein